MPKCVPCQISTKLIKLTCFFLLQNKHKDFNPNDLCTNRTQYVTQDSRNQIYENYPIQRRDDAIYENSPESEDFYETRLPAS